MAEEDPRLSEDEPLAEADAVECEAVADQAEYSPSDRDAPAPESEVSFREEVFETFKPRTDVLVPSPVDGMPIPRDEKTSLATAHPFTFETMTCVEDDRQYVELFDDELTIARGWSSIVEPGGRVPLADVKHTMQGRLSAARSEYDESGKLRAREVYEPAQVERMFGVLVAKSRRALVPVRPVREACVHYKRQIMANDDAPNPEEFGHFIVFRNCTMRRSVGGAFMTLRDEAMYACDYREPPDPDSVEKHLDSRDRKALASKRHLELVRPFGLKG
jgi:hypothetical protein